MRIVIIAGIRPQFIKLASMQRTINKWNVNGIHKIDTYYINSGQHYDKEVASTYIEELSVHFDIDLTNTYSTRRPIDVLGNMVIHLYDALDRIEKPDWVIVFGDANTTLAGAIAAVKKKIPLVHIEAGLRSGEINNPEEHNRIVADHLATVNFLSSKIDGENLQREGLAKHSYWVGDIVYDLVLDITRELPNAFGSFKAGEYILCTIHREENVLSNETMGNIMRALANYNKRVVFVVHPRTYSRLKLLGLDRFENVNFIKMLSYKDMLLALKGCAFVFTDSGTLQREAYYLKKHCLVRQDKPFWPNLVKLGINRTVGTRSEEITLELSNMQDLLKSRYPLTDDFGDGSAGLKILRKLIEISEETSIS